ncbi:WD repeat-containing protein WRAP73-like isoform X2 [Periplaneta americana]|uniref:WD repeat-containing protein WRAP73-like isoform X2 n=1 Tax=Periplaneta americana TaxID=6978 RepID=UPI0037E89CD6
MAGEHSKESMFMSPCGEMLSHIDGHKVLIKMVETLLIKETFTCDGAINYLEWSADSCMLLCVALKEAVIHVFWVFEPNRNMRFHEGGSGLTTACFTPDGKGVLVSLRSGLSVRIYSLYHGITHTLPGARVLANDLPGIAFSPDGKLLVVAERQKDQLSLYSCKTWIALQTLHCADLQGMAWSPDSLSLAVWSKKHHQQSKLQIFLLDGHCLYSETKNDGAICNAVWSPSSHMLAISDCDSKYLKILNCLTWSVIAELEPARDLLEAGLDDIVHDVVSLQSEICSLSILSSICLAWDTHGYLLIWATKEEVVRWNSKDQSLSRLAVKCL